VNILLLRPGDNWLDATTVHITDHRADHLRQVLRSAVGESIRVGVVGGQRGVALIEAIDASGVTLRVALSEPPPPRHRFDNKIKQKKHRKSQKETHRIKK
jgi:16S rRNA (uracil1498-N3)-methyltransferase